MIKLYKGDAKLNEYMHEEYNEEYDEEDNNVLVESLGSAYKIYLDKDIEEPSKYRNILQCLELATALDRITFYISSDGGELPSGTMIANAIRETQAYTTSVIETCACSAASLIPMVTDNLIMKPHSFIMVHSASYYFGDELQKVKKYVDFQHERIYHLFNAFYKGFLTNSEIEDMVNNSSEMWIGPEDAMKRFLKRKQYLRYVNTNERIKNDKQL